MYPHVTKQPKQETSREDVIGVIVFVQSGLLTSLSTTSAFLPSNADTAWWMATGHSESNSSAVDGPILAGSGFVGLATAALREKSWADGSEIRDDGMKQEKS